ncbi:MAG TPA: DUF5808 domain-containing protein [Acidimicrobiales bacterium]|nr:DUF5808 domain-containing protein [Acidimicrobiales bacterium]
MKARGKIRQLIKTAGMVLAVTAVAKELRTPPEQRRWHGKLAGVVPYDFRPPTWERLRRSVWNPQSERLLVPQAFGVGWTLNLGRVVQLVRSRS